MRWLAAGDAGLRESAGANGGHCSSEKCDASHRYPRTTLPSLAPSIPHVRQAQRYSTIEQHRKKRERRPNHRLVPLSLWMTDVYLHPIEPLIAIAFNLHALEEHRLLQALNGAPQMETKMRKRVLSILGLLVMSALTIQTATAAPRGARSARVAASATHQPRDAFGSASKAVGTKSCDIVWCYEN
jgi:hypothetical protein